MASSSISFSCAPSLATSLFSTTSSSSPRLLSSRFLGIRKVKRQIRPARLGPSNGSKPLAGSSSARSESSPKMPESMAVSLSDDFDRDDVEHYFNYMGMLAVEGTYSKMEALVNLNIHPVDILLLLAAKEGDRPKIDELLRAGADYSVKNGDGRTALDRANSEEIRDLILDYTAQKA